MAKIICLLAFLLLVPFVFSSCSRRVVTVYYEEKAQIELLSSRNKRILIDVYDSSVLSRPQNNSDILLTTHTHSDHYNFSFYYDFEGTSLFVREGKIESDDIHIRSIFGGHSDADPYKNENGSNYIFIIDMDDLRIVHFGDLGQESLSSEQLAAIGEVDVAIMQLFNPYSMMDLANKKGFNLMNQINPKLIIPTHITSEAAQLAHTIWECNYSNAKAVRINKRNLGEQTQLLFLGKNASEYGSLTRAKEWK